MCGSFLSCVVVDRKKSGVEGEIGSVCMFCVCFVKQVFVGFVCCRPSEQTIRPTAIFATMLSDLVFPFFVYYIEAGDLVCVFAAIANRQTCTMCFGLNE